MSLPDATGVSQEKALTLHLHVRQNTRSSGNPVHGRAPDDVARPGADGDADSPDSSVVVARLMGGVEYGRPLATGWSGTLGVNWLRTKCLDEHGNTVMQARRCSLHLNV